MPWKESEAVPESNGPVPQQEQLGSGQPTLEEMSRMIDEFVDRWDKWLDRSFKKQEKCAEEIRSIEQHTASLGHGARQPRLAKEADGQANTRLARVHEGAANAVQAMHGNSCTAQNVQDGPKSNSTSSGVEAEPPDLPCRDNVLVEGGDAATRSCLPSLELHSSTAAGGLIPTSKASTATETNFN